MEIMKTKIFKPFAAIMIAFALRLTTPCALADVEFNVLVSFTGTSGSYLGEYPWTGLVQGGDGNLYGTTELGGMLDCDDMSCHGGVGTVFKISTNGEFTCLHSFTSDSSDGWNLYGNGLVQGADGAFYGTTEQGPGANGAGTVFRITADGTLTTLAAFDFGDTNSPAMPRASLVQGEDGNFYGTSIWGGAYGWGTVFRVTPLGAVTILHSFNGSEGATPEKPLVQAGDGCFYGIADEGGIGWPANAGGGTLFKIAPNGTFTNLHFFAGVVPDNGEWSTSALGPGNDGNLYGTDGNSSGFGGIFKITPDGTMNVVHSFNGNDGDGLTSSGLMLGRDGNFYGACAEGIYMMTPNGTVITLYANSQTGLPETGKDPLIQGADGSFYGTSSIGGANSYGTIFRLTLDHTPPMIQSLLQTNSLLTFTWSATPGLTYQAQYTSNLTSTNWFNLGSPVTATNATACASDSMTSSQCFYRIMLLQ
jgi:uncharacterized repeat protein (TIGR03803 family)